jgi:hypothetical protein
LKNSKFLKLTKKGEKGKGRAERETPPTGGHPEAKPHSRGTNERRIETKNVFM